MYFFLFSRFNKIELAIGLQDLSNEQLQLLQPLRTHHQFHQQNRTCQRLIEEENLDPSILLLQLQIMKKVHFYIHLSFQQYNNLMLVLVSIFINI